MEEMAGFFRLEPLLKNILEKNQNMELEHPTIVQCWDEILRMKKQEEEKRKEKLQ